MTVSTAAFISSFIFLIGIVMMLLSPVPALRERYPNLFMQGFMLTLLSVGLMVVAAFVLT